MTGQFVGDWFFFNSVGMHVSVSKYFHISFKVALNHLQSGELEHFSLFWGDFYTNIDRLSIMNKKLGICESVKCCDWHWNHVFI